MEKPYILWTGKLKYPYEEDAYRLVHCYLPGDVVCEASSTDAMDAESWVACPQALTASLIAAVLHLTGQQDQTKQVIHDALVAEGELPPKGRRLK